MDNPQPQGNFIGGLNRGKEPGSKQPDFTGRLSIPGREGEHAIAVWTHQDATGKPYFAGRMEAMPMTDDVEAQIQHLAAPQLEVADATPAGANLTLRPREFVLFGNRFREPVEGDTPQQAQDRAKRPHYWGRLNPGDGTAVVALSVWLKQDRYNRPLLAGATSYPQPGKAVEASAQLDMHEMNAPSPAPEGDLAGKGRKRASRDSRA